jgi:hypothetical protein
MTWWWQPVGYTGGGIGGFANSRGHPPSLEQTLHGILSGGPVEQYEDSALAFCLSPRPHTLPTNAVAMKRRHDENELAAEQMLVTEHVNRGGPSQR